MLEKPEYDCNNLDEYDCGCGEEGEEKEEEADEAQAALLKVTKKEQTDYDSNAAVEITKEP